MSKPLNQSLMEDKGISVKDQNEIVNHLIKLFELPPYITKLKISWEGGGVVLVECESIPRNNVTREYEE